MKTIPLAELKRLAFVWAEQDRCGLAACYPKNSTEHAKHASEAAQLKAYRQKRFGKTAGDLIDESPTKVINVKLLRPSEGKYPS